MVKITATYFYQDAEGDSDFEYIENTPQAKEDFVKQYANINDEDVKSFIKGDCKTCEYVTMGDWDDPTSVVFTITTYDEEVEQIQNEISRLQNKLTTLEEKYKIGD